jgi:hypothetical protein
MTREVLGKCPVCSGNTQITGIVCNDCGTKIEGSFHMCKFCRLNTEQKNFLDVFIKCRGNIKEVEKEMGISYPTVRNKLEDVAAALGYKPEPMPEEPGRKKEILDKLNNGELSVEEALEKLKED